MKVLELESISPNVHEVQFPKMLTMLEEAVYRGDVPFLLNVNHKGVQFLAPFPEFTMTMYYDL